MRIINDTIRALPSAVAPQDISASGTPPSSNADIHVYEKKWQDFYIVIEDATGANVAITDAEIEIYGYTDNDSTPILIYKADISSDRGRIAVPISSIPDVKYLYPRQSADSNPIGAAGADNPACNYRMMFNAKWSNG